MNLKELPEADRDRLMAALDKLAHDHMKTLYNHRHGKLTYPLAESEVLELTDEINHISALRLLVQASALRMPEQAELT